MKVINNLNRSLFFFSSSCSSNSFGESTISIDNINVPQLCVCVSVHASVCGQDDAGI